MTWKTVSKIQCAHCNSTNVSDILTQPKISFKVNCEKCGKKTKVYLKSGEATTDTDENIKIKKI